MRRRDGSSNAHGLAVRHVPLQQPSCREYTSRRLRSPLRRPGASEPQEEAGHPGRPAQSSPPKQHWGGFAFRGKQVAGRCAPKPCLSPFRPPLGETGEKGRKAPGRKPWPAPRSRSRWSPGPHIVSSLSYAFTRKSQLSRMRKTAEIWAKTLVFARFRLVSLWCSMVQYRHRRTVRRRKKNGPPRLAPAASPDRSLF